MTQDDAFEPVGRAKGGVARAAKLSPERRSDIARRAALARYGDKPIKATHKGNFKDEFGIDVECYVLDDVAKTPVISQIGMAKVLGLASRGNAFPRFMASKAMADFVGAGLREKLEKVLIFQWGSAGAGQQPMTLTYGYDAALLIDVCQAIMAANAAGKLKSHQAKVAAQAGIVAGAAAKSGIKGLVYALAGYSPTTEEVITAFKLYVKEEARKYEQEFPNDLYAQWHRLYQIPVPLRGKPWQFKHLTVGHVYHPLARSNGKILRLTKEAKTDSQKVNKKLHQFLSEIGVKALRTHLGQLLGIARISKTQQQYEDHVETLFGQQPDLFKT